MFIIIMNEMDVMDNEEKKTIINIPTSNRDNLIIEGVWERHVQLSLFLSQSPYIFSMERVEEFISVYTDLLERI
jgi:hypothetical protein